jgi:hypothetical protein
MNGEEGWGIPLFGQQIKKDSFTVIGSDRATIEKKIT